MYLRSDLLSKACRLKDGWQWNCKLTNLDVRLKADLCLHGVPLEQQYLFLAVFFLDLPLCLCLAATSLLYSHLNVFSEILHIQFHHFCLPAQTTASYDRTQASSWFSADSDLFTWNVDPHFRTADHYIWKAIGVNSFKLPHFIQFKLTFLFDIYFHTLQWVSLPLHSNSALSVLQMWTHAPLKDRFALCFFTFWENILLLNDFLFVFPENNGFYFTSLALKFHMEEFYNRPPDTIFSSSLKILLL